MNKEAISNYDKSDMFGVIREFPQQVEDAVRNAESFSFENFEKDKIRNIVLSGLGGSAIGGDFARSYLAEELKIPFNVNRGYEIPEYCDETTLVIISSYSGNTEETVSAYKAAIKKNCTIVCITSNGEVEKIAKENNHPYVKLPPGYQPRAALGYSFFSVLLIMTKLGFCPDKKNEIDPAVSMLKKMSDELSRIEDGVNRSLELAQKIKSHLPVIYSSAELLEAVNLRWRGQIEENAKMLAYGNFYPEMNHNELVGWNPPQPEYSELIKKLFIIFLKDKDDNERVKIRMNITKELYEEHASVIEMHSEGKSRLERLFSLTYFADWLTFYLAILNKVDPTPVEAIEHLKKRLAE